MPPRRSFTDAEVDAVLKSFEGGEEERNKACFLTMLLTGYRVSEMLSLKVKSVWSGRDWKKQITVPKECMKFKKRARTVVLHPELHEVLRPLVEGRKGDAWLFESQWKKSPDDGTRRTLHRNSVLRIFKKACKVAGLELSELGTHSCRKKFAMRLYERNHDIYAVCKHLGHQSVETTKAYLQVEQAAMDADVLALPGFLEEKKQ